MIVSAAAACTSRKTEVEPKRVVEPRREVVTGGVAKVDAASEVPGATESAPVRPPHAWLDDAKYDGPPAVDTLDVRFAPPAGFVRVSLQPSSFGVFLRTLPLAAAGTPVVSYAGGVIHPASHENIAAVVAIDVGHGDLQQCADSVIRLHAEWRWSTGDRAPHYRAATGMELAFTRYVEGERLLYKDSVLTSSKIAGKSEPTHPVMRRWLDEVFGWANTASLGKEAKKIAIADATVGDFFVMPGVPFGHAVMILDMARGEGGKRVVLLGQGYMPAQSFQVLRPSAGRTWFPIDESSGEMVTPFWRPFPFDTLRRLD